jgi:PTH1 family peptidyl-tRNA hydrolase
VYLVVGLQNPGSRYEATRHNLGGRIVADFGQSHGATFKKARRFISAEVAEIALPDGVRVVAAIPTTFMNESGNAIAPLARYYKIHDADDILVVHDDIDLPFAKLKVQRGGGAGGNNGVKSVARSLRTPDFWRLKVGVGRPPGRMDPADFVLRPFAVSERDDIDLAVRYAADLVGLYVAEGGDTARQRAGEINALLREGR